jgi:site-specific DNA-methyltransferase (cytosine-N4-specific)
MDFADQFLRVLTEDGSLVINIGGSWNRGKPTRSTYQFELIIELAKKFHLAQEFYWYNPAKLPAPAEWVTVRRIRVKDSVELVLWLSKSPFPKADNRKILQPYSKDMQRLIERGYVAKKRPSGHNITSKFQRDNKGAIPPNLLQVGNNDANSPYLQKCKESNMKPHPARFPKELPQLFIDFLTDQGDVVMDPFCGSNMTGIVAETRKRRWIGIESIEDYLKASEFRFPHIYR